MVNPNDRISDDAMQRLSELMNDSPTLLKLHGTEWEIRALRPGTQWLIAEEACKIVRQENAAIGDVIKEFALNLPSVCRVLTYALINDKSLTERDNALYNKVYDTLMWGEYDMKDWVTILFEVLSLINVDFFFASTDVITTLRQMTLTRKQTRKEQRLSTAAQSGVR